MKYAVRTFIEGSNERIDAICRTYSSMKRSAYSLLRDGKRPREVRTILRARYGIANARWAEYPIIEARGVIASQKVTISYRIEMCEQKIIDMLEKVRHLRNPMKIRGCNVKLERLARKLSELKEQEVNGSFPRVVFGTKRLLHQLSIANQKGRRKELSKEWEERRSKGFFSVGAANDNGNANTRLLYRAADDSFSLEIRNWKGGDFAVPLHVPCHWRDLLREMVNVSWSYNKRKPRDSANKGLPYTVRVIRSKSGYQVMVSFDLEEPRVEWSGRIAGIDVNPGGIACTIVSDDGNLIATRFFSDRRFVTARGNKRKWALEHIVNKMLRWCRDTHGCNAVALEEMRFKGVYSFSRRNNYVLSNFMKHKMASRIQLAALKMDMLSVLVPAAYTSLVALAKYRRGYGGFGRHQLAAFVIGRRALGFGEIPTARCMPETRKDHKMWNYCAAFYGHQSQVQTLFRREPLEWKSAGNVNGVGLMTKLLTAPPADTSEKGSSHDALAKVCELDQSNENLAGRAGRVHPNGQTSRGDGARGHRVNPPNHQDGVSGPAANVVVAAASKLSTNQKIPQARLNSPSP